MWNILILSMWLIPITWCLPWVLIHMKIFPSGDNMNSKNHLCLLINLKWPALLNKSRQDLNQKKTMIFWEKCHFLYNCWIKDRQSTNQGLEVHQEENLSRKVSKSKLKVAKYLKLIPKLKNKKRHSWIRKIKDSA